MRGKLYQPALNDIAHAVALDPKTLFIGLNWHRQTCELRKSKKLLSRQNNV